MAFITLVGTLRDPTSELAVGDQIRFTHKSTTGETVEGAVSVLTIDPSGTYSKDLQYGLVLVEYKDVRTSQFKNLGVATVNGSNPATSIPELLNALVPVSSAELIEFQAILADAVTARNEAEAFAASIDLINDLSQAYIFDTVAEYKASAIVFPAGKTVHLNDRDADFTVITGVGTANTFDIIANTTTNQSIKFIGNKIKTSQAGVTELTTDANITLTSIQDRYAHIVIDTSCETLGRWDLVSNLTVEWTTGSVLKKNAAFPSEKAAVWLPDIDNVNLLNPCVDGNRYNVSNASEQGHLIDIRGSSNVTVENGRCINANGDGYYVGAGGVNSFSTNIHLNNCTGDNNRRQALSISSVKGFRAPNFRGLNTNGIAPTAGIDIEPNGNSDELKDIVLDNPATDNNDGAGIIIALNLIAGALPKDISITINNHEDDGSLLGFQFEKVSLDGNAALSGVIRSVDPIWRKSSIGSFIMRDYDARAPQVQLIRPTVIDPNVFGGASAKSHSAFICFAELADSGAGVIGALRIIEPRFDFRQNAPIKYFHFKDERAGRLVTDIQVINPVEAINPLANANFAWVGGGNIKDDNNVIPQDLSLDFAITTSNYIGVYRNVATSVIKITLPAGQATGDPSVTLEKSDSAGSSATFTVAPPSGGAITGHPVASVANKTWQCTGEGSRITLKPVGFNKWVVTNIEGDWSESP